MGKMRKHFRKIVRGADGKGRLSKGLQGRLPRELFCPALEGGGLEEMEKILLHAVTSVLTVAVWAVLSGDLGQASGVVVLYWLIFWAAAEAAERTGKGIGMQDGGLCQGPGGKERDQKAS